MAASPNFFDSLSPLQKRLIATASGMVAFAVILTFLLLVLFALRGFVGMFGSVLWPLAVAGIFALLLRPIVQWFHDRLKIGRVWSIILLYVLVLLAAGGLLALIGPVLVEQALKFIERIPNLVENLRTAAAQQFPIVHEFLVKQLGEARLAEYTEMVRQQTSQLAARLMPAAQDLFGQMSSIFSIVAGVAIVPVYLFFFLKTERDPTLDIKEQLSFIRDDWRDDAIFLGREFVASMEAFFRGQILIGMIMGVLLAIGFSLVGVNFAIGLGLLIGALNIIPYFGTIIGLLSVLPIAYFQPEGGMLTAALALTVFVVVQLVESYFLTPKIMGQKTGLHPLVIIIAIFFWGTALGGILGMILAIPLTAFFVVAWRLVKKKYLEPMKKAT